MKSTTPQQTSPTSCSIKSQSYINRKSVRRTLIIGALLYIAPLFMGIYLAFGIVDLLRNKPLNFRTAYQYFLGHGNITWILSPINLAIDLLCLPFINKGVYSIDQLPRDCQTEIEQLITTLHSKNITEQLDKKLSGNDREMIFFKWYGQNIDTSIDISEFHQEYNYIQTIGVSVFNKKRSTSRHFGPMRLTLRVLYNINKTDSDQIYIEVGNTRHYWKDNRLFVFDDTLEHQSFNESDEVRYCAFIDIIRPSLAHRVMQRLTKLFGASLRKANHLFYNRWSFIK